LSMDDDVGVTGNALPADIKHFIAHGAAEVLVKPITKNDLLKSLGRYM